MKGEAIRLLLLLQLLALIGCGPLSSPTESLYAPAKKVRSSEAMMIAEAYRQHLWTPSEANAFHGSDRAGVSVNTPDIYLAGGRGWWKINEVNTGIPYMWGGFDTPTTFDEKLSAGYFAGDVYTSEKRKGLRMAVSQQACGVDCSGFVSRCLRLPRAYSTRELPALCEELPSFDLLQTGDIINKHNEHVLLFERFTDASKTKMIAYQTGGPSALKVTRNIVITSFLKTTGYRPYRYRNMNYDVTYSGES